MIDMTREEAERIAQFEREVEFDEEPDNEYDKMAYDFLEKTGSTISATCFAEVEGFPDGEDRMMHNAYWCCLKRTEGERTGELSFSFFGSYVDWRDGDDPSYYDLLTCMPTYDVGDIDEYVSMFGFEVRKWEDVKKIERSYEEWCRQYQTLAQMYTEQELAELAEIV